MAKGTLGRLANIWKAQVNDLLDSMEDPEKQLSQLIHDMENAVGRALAELAEAMAARRRLEQQKEQLGRQLEQWQARAEQAMAAGDEEQARQALAHKTVQADRLEALQPTLANSREAVVQLRAHLEQMRDRLHQAEHRRRELLVRFRAARRELEAQTDRPGCENDPVLRFQRLEARIQEQEADLARFEQRIEATAIEAELFRELGGEGKQAERELKESDQQRQLDQELAKLREQVKKDEHPVR